MDTQGINADLTQRDIRYRSFLINEAQGLLTRLKQLQPFEMSMPMVIAAAVPYIAQKEIYTLMTVGKAHLTERVLSFIKNVKTKNTSIERCQAAYAVLKLRFNSLLDQFDIFCDVVSQRGENETGIWIAGLDVLARDALVMTRFFVEAPPMICYLDRGHGAAIRRAHTRLPGGDDNPVAVIKIPRERMVASGIGSSLIHEVGHQGSALLDLISSLRLVLDDLAAKEAPYVQAWTLLSRWISEILSDFWAIGFLGISASTGLISVVSLPRYFVFRAVDDDPHPFPWIRVKISIAFGKLLYPDDQWQRLERLWETFYPPTGLPTAMQQLLQQLEAVLPRFAQLVKEHRPPKLKGKQLHEIFPLHERQPHQLRVRYQQWKKDLSLLARQRPSLVFATIGQARADNVITPFTENRLLTKMLRHWALMNI
ncbi:hypothetical protein [Chitinophaga flava]|uniref:Uncharacterized protein n=1 Tax=Chitinophaga flava TaxID=2259036 RepID=A0A365XYU2_9BACT|nr:hypothetical protein [Chitinophaga flava]RBL91161.1 hypothetical protein DF182_00625 [Chitinophaga flava]